MAWRSEVRVIAFESTKSITVTNVGDGPVLLSYITVDILGIDSSSFALNTMLKPGEVLTKDFPSSPESQAYVLINHSTIESWRRAILEAKPGFGRNCVAAVVVSQNDPSLMMYQDVHKRDPHELRYLQASMSLHYNDLRQGPEHTEVPVRGLLYARRDCEAGRQVFRQMNRKAPVASP